MRLSGCDEAILVKRTRQTRRTSECRFNQLTGDKQAVYSAVETIARACARSEALRYARAIIGIGL